ncbi:HNH endonuclease signature motif containing protein [Burkholderia gladioli]|uniref:HNH endonuclease n=1 Tax=Burkholderia gladioli TaxID=28095 RepID=UPI000AAD4384|nr:HNH endonuclease signature motif containing protein [Burkholderia gladioli]
MVTISTSDDTLTEQGRRLLRFLVGRLSKVRSDDPRTFVGYKEIHDALGLQQEGQSFGDSLKHQGLTSLANWTASTGKPGITGLIIDKVTLMPGQGYFKLFGRTPEDFRWWFSEIEKSTTYPWEDFLGSSDGLPEENSGEAWSREELSASVKAYLEMQLLDRNGAPFKKQTYYSELGTRFGRTTKSFEYRMQNISYVLALMGRDWLTGLKPAKNVGANVAAQIEEMIAEFEGRTITPVAAFEIAVRENVSKKDLALPRGNERPTTFTASVTQYQRDAIVKAWVLREADGICECCHQEAPFTGPDGRPYLEVHHVKKLAEQGADSIDNAVAVCPNCHRELHYGQSAKTLADDLYGKIPRLRRS